MLHAILPSTSGRDLPYFLAAEEWVASHMAASSSCFFAWQVPPTVICGRNQDMPSEVDLDFCYSRGIEVWRRKSGGGAVYADGNNVMFSYIGPRASVQDAFCSYTSRVVEALRGLGIHAEASGRNDICIDGRKVAGNAFFQTATRNIVHGTMLFDVDAEAMAGALTPARAKLESNRVLSVPSRITTVRSCRPDLTLDAFVQHILDCVCDGTVEVPSGAVGEIERIAGDYRRPEFRYGGVLARRGGVHVAGVGQIAARTLLRDGAIAEVRLSGDFFAGDSLDAALAGLRGVRPDASAIADALGAEPHVSGLSNQALARLIVENTF